MGKANQARSHDVEFINPWLELSLVSSSRCTHTKISIYNNKELHTAGIV